MAQRFVQLCVFGALTDTSDLSQFRVLVIYLRGMLVAWNMLN